MEETGERVPIAFVIKEKGTRRRCHESVAWAPGENREDFVMWALEAKDGNSFQKLETARKAGSWVLSTRCLETQFRLLGSGAVRKDVCGRAKERACGFRYEEPRQL